jgi:hypothetical protein
MALGRLFWHETRNFISEMSSGEICPFVVDRFPVVFNVPFSF